MDNLSIKKKLVLAFISIAILVTILSAYSIYSVTKASDGFTDYREMARNSILASRVQANMLMIRMNVKDYLKTVSSKDITEFNQYYDITSSFIKKAQKEIKDPLRASMVQEVSDDLKTYKKGFFEVIAFMNTRNNIVHNNLDINGKIIEQLLTSVSRSAKKDKDIKAVLTTNEGLRSLLLARLYTAKYLATNLKSNATRVNEEFDDLSKELVVINNEIQDPIRTKQLKEAVSLIAKYKEGVNNIVSLIEKRNSIINMQLNVIGPKIAKKSENMKLLIKKEQDTLGPEVAQLNNTLKHSSIIISSFILILIFALSILIPKNIRYSLNSLHQGVKNLLDSSSRSSRVSINSDDEIGAISQDFNKYLQKIEDNMIEDEKLVEQANLILQGNYNITISPRNNQDMLGITLQHITMSLRDFAEVAQGVSNGNLAIKVKVKSENDTLALSINKMVDTLNDIALHADKIAQGNFKSNISPKSNSDVLGNALHNMTNNLREVAKENFIRQWLQTGQENIYNLLREEHKSEYLSEELLKILAQYTGAIVGMIYIHNEIEEYLEEHARYGYPIDEIPDIKYKVGDGIVGQCAKDNQTVILHDVPKDYFHIESGLGQAIPDNLILIPFLFRGELRGVIELGFFGDIREDVETLLENLREGIGIAYENISSKDKLITQSNKLKLQKEGLEHSKKALEHIHRHTQESIEYASLIQGALIPENQVFKKYFSSHLIIWQQKDIVGGDIYLFEELRDKDECLLMVIDCTGHGVPGAFVTMLVKAIERQVIAKINNDKNIDVSPAWILSYFNKTMKKLLKQENEDSVSNAGFDGGVIYYNKRENILKFSGAETPLFYIVDEELATIKGDRHSIGYKKSNADFEFKEHTIDLKEGMQFYITTDGYLDQNGGEKDFPFSKKRFSKLIQEHHQMNFSDQKKILLDTLERYQGDGDRNDDITLVGFKI
jgi:serine phosphatase RsbU (regulator of sigma subunit)/putative methionine-R-sulfoxide reductase with GAF domain